MKTLIGVTAALVLTLTLNACGSGNSVQNTPDVPPPMVEAYLTTDSASYTPSVTAQTADFTLTATFVNRRENPIYVATCGNDLPLHVLQKYIDGKWRDVSETVEYGCASELQLNEIASQGELAKTFRIFFDMPYDLPGFYRLQWTSVFSEADVNALPVGIEQRVSSSFEIK